MEFREELWIRFRHTMCMQTRRKFLRDCSLAAVTASLAPAVALAQSRPGRMTGHEGTGYAQFAGQVNTPFFVRAGSQTVKLLLVEARPFSAASPDAPDAGNEKFSLQFRGPVQQPLAQDTYRFDHPRLGRLAIFIVPIGSLDPLRCHYEAIFDRPVNAVNLAALLARAPRRIQNS